MNFSNENVYEAIIEIKDRHIEKLEKWVFVLIFITSISIGSVVAVNDHYQPQLDGLTKQLDRTQKQLKKVSEESADKTDRIAELTNNGG